MSSLRIFSPHQLSVYAPVPEHPGEGVDDEPVILPFRRDIPRARNPRFTAGMSARRSSAVNPGETLRLAREVRAQRDCPDCGRARVLPLVEGASRSEQGWMPIPFSGKIVGYQCGGCGHSWRG